MAGQVKVEFTIEPFVDGELVERVTTTIAAIESMGVSVEVGPFGSSFVVGPEKVGDVIGVLVATAYGHGATHVNIDTEIIS
jgi:uncharacterized protein YqgV (UPF0045/DUF77 family)